MARKNIEMDPATKQFNEGLEFINRHPMFAPLASHAQFVRKEGNLCPDQGWAVVTKNGQIHIHPKKRATSQEWIYILAHCLLHLGFGHFQEKERQDLWNTACDSFVAKFLWDMKLGKPPAEMDSGIDYSVKSEEELYRIFLENGVPSGLTILGTAGQGYSDMHLRSPQSHWDRKVDWPDCFGKGLAMAVSSAVKVTAGYEAFLGAEKEALTQAQKAKNWFMNSYPLLGALAADFKIIEDPLLCQRLSISIAAVDVEMKEIYMNPAAGLDEQENRFVMAHEILHVGLRHHARAEGRDPYLWNVACDYVINHWLMEMGLGAFPRVGGLFDPELKGLSAETIYDRIVTDIRLYRKLATFRGVGLGDIMEPQTPDWWNRKDGASLDEFYRSALSQGLVYHEEQNRGLLPAGLVEEIKALAQPPIAWDVELAKWFDHYFSPIEKIRTYARVSRRQSSTPDIPRPRWIPNAGDEEGRTFGVVLDTSGSMDSKLLAKALGAIASYSISRDVPLVRVLFCDAAVYDQGYMAPEDIADRVAVKGRGGTVIQPAIDLLETAEDFPRKGPLLIITDGYCDRLTIRREHAYILPKGQHLPFVPRGKVFRI
ncbi:peptidase [Cohnella endophytica]|uniref:Peptidase n=1 Tax=Cohnella endophytica TaxID=2419778 RepID=A0A494XP59_9BACL|nr:VWA-like domain-containing protein [Cohnella endophytica]RKP49844.1 peptidase [Cohnella endophytica]